MKKFDRVFFLYMILNPGTNPIFVIREFIRGRYLSISITQGADVVSRSTDLTEIVNSLIKVFHFLRPMRIALICGPPPEESELNSKGLLSMHVQEVREAMYLSWIEFVSEMS